MGCLMTCSLVAVIVDYKRKKHFPLTQQWSVFFTVLDTRWTREPGGAMENQLEKNTI